MTPKRATSDVVVVGGGAAGCVVAARLAASGSRSVLLLEAGPDRRADTPPELRNGWTIERESFDWGYVSEPHSSGTVRSLRRKKLLGGTSWLTRFTLRGSPADYDGWGIAGWGWDEVLPYFVRLEADADFGDAPWHGDAGPIPSRRYLELEHTEVCDAAVRALPALGFANVDDHNRPGAVGVGRMPTNTRDGVRVTTADAYLPLGARPRNLTVHADAHVASVLFDRTRARGVRLVDGTTVEAGRVVLCAGTYGSPPILMRSGVGPEKHLRELRIPVRVDLPGVGANLADHPALYLDFGYAGPGRSAPVLHTVATFHSAGRPGGETPDLMFWLGDPTEADPSFGVEVLLLRPLARGAVRLRSSDPADPPVISLPVLTDPADLGRLAEAYRRALELAHRPEVRRLCAGAAPSEPRDLHALIRAEHYSIPHVVGTCAMGTRAEDGAVVDAYGSVHGTSDLSVVDASIIPDAPSGFTHIPTIMLAERLSEHIPPQL